MRPQAGVPGLEQRFRAIEEKQARMEAMLGITSTTGAAAALGGGGGLGAGFGFDGTMIGIVEGFAPPIEVGDFTEPEPIVWTKVVSDYGVEFEDERIQMPSDGLFMIFLNYGEVWARRTNRAGNAGTLAQVIDGGIMAGAVLFASSTFGTETTAAALIGGTLLAYGNAVALGLSSLYNPDGRPPGVILPTRIDVTAEIHRILEG